jgi:hypothetical protein
MRKLATLSYVEKMVHGSVPAEGGVVVKICLRDQFATKAQIADFLGIQESQVVKKAGNLKAHTVRNLCQHILDLNSK